MWQRLKNSVLALSVSTLAVIAVLGFGEPHPDASAPVLIQPSVPQLSAETQIALLIGAKLAAVVIDELARNAQGAEVDSTTPKISRQASGGNLRMPFYSFGSRTARLRER